MEKGYKSKIKEKNIEIKNKNKKSRQKSRMKFHIKKGNKSRYKKGK